MRALSLWQPWASLVAVGLKQVETRGWRAAWRGRFAVHATKVWQVVPELVPIIEKHGLLEAHFDWPRGAIVATAELFECVPVEALRDSLSPLERKLGNYTDGRYALRLRDVRPLATPIRARGAQGWWNWTPPKGFTP